MGNVDETTDADLVTAALATRIYAAYVAGRASREIEARLAENAFALTPLTLGLLHFLRHGERTLAEISRYMPAPPSTLVPVVDALENRGLVRRGRDPRDRRRTPLTLTDEGRVALASVPRLTGFAAILEAMRAMDPGKARQLADLLGELVAEMGGEEIARDVSDAVKTGASRHRGLETGGEQPQGVQADIGTPLAGGKGSG